MVNAAECPPAETLALLPDGRGSRKVRQTLIAHLDGCTRCRVILAYTGQYEAAREPGPIQGEDSHLWHFWGIGPRFSLVCGVLLAVSVLTLLITAQLDNARTGVGRLSAEAIVLPLFESTVGLPYSDQRWTDHTNSFLFGSGLTRTQTAFRIGVQEIDFRVAIEDSRWEDASAALRTLRSLSQVAGDPESFSERWTALEEALSRGDSKERFVEELAGLDGSLYAELDPVALDLGRWAEASRLAAACRATRYFGATSFELMLDDLNNRHLPTPVEEELHRIRTYTASPSGADMEKLQKAFRQIILLH